MNRYVFFKGQFFWWCIWTCMSRISSRQSKQCLERCLCPNTYSKAHEQLSWEVWLWFLVAWFQVGIVCFSNSLNFKIQTLNFSFRPQFHWIHRKNLLSRSSYPCIYLGFKMLGWHQVSCSLKLIIILWSNLPIFLAQNPIINYFQSKASPSTIDSNSKRF